MLSWHKHTATGTERGMAVREQRHLAIADSDFAWLRLAIVLVTGMALLVGMIRVGSPMVWLIIGIAAVYAVANSFLDLHRRFRSIFTYRTYAFLDLLLITLLVYFTGGQNSPLFLLYGIPLSIAVLRYGADAGAAYCLVTTALYSSAVLFHGLNGPFHWLAQIGLLWTLYLVMAYVYYSDDTRQDKARRRDELGALHRAAAAPIHTGDIPTVIGNILSGALSATNCCWAAVYLYEEKDDRFTDCYSLSCSDLDSDVKHETPWVAPSDILYTVIYTNSPRNTQDLLSDKRFQNSVLNNGIIRSAVIMPMFAPGAKRVGVFVLGREEPHRVSQHELRFASTLAVQAAVSIHTAFLFEEAKTIEAAKEADKLRSQLLGTVSHELRTPIAAIQGFASSLKCADEVEIPKEMQQDWINEIEQNAERLRRLVTDLLDLSRLESGALRMQMEWQDMNDVLDELAPDLQMIAEGRNLVVQVSDTLPLIKCDAERIGQVLRNLVENARKFSPPGSNIVVGAERYENGIRVGVLDEGEGIPPEYHDKIFERFFQIEGASFRPQKGTGLGLAICRNIVEAHGGRIWVESSPGKGSIFYFTLPVTGS